MDENPTMTSEASRMSDIADLAMKHTLLVRVLEKFARQHDGYLGAIRAAMADNDRARAIGMLDDERARATLFADALTALSKATGDQATTLHALAKRKLLDAGETLADMSDPAVRAWAHHLARAELRGLKVALGDVEDSGVIPQPLEA